MVELAKIIIGFAHIRNIGGGLPSEDKLLDLLDERMFLEVNTKVYDLWRYVQSQKTGVKIDGLKIKTSDLVDCIIPAYELERLTLDMVDEFVSNYKEKLSARLLGQGQTIEEVAEAIKKIDSNSFEDNAEEVIRSFEEQQRELEQARYTGLLGMSTGIKKLDKATLGIQKKQVWIVGGYTGSGKTYLALNLALKAIDQLGVVMIVSLEMPSSEVISRMIGIASGLGSHPMNLTSQELDIWNEVKAGILLAIQDGRLIIIDKLSDIHDVTKAIDKANRKKKVDLVIVDYIQQFTGEKSIYESMSKASNELQKLTLRLNVAMIIVSQVSNEGQKDADFMTMSYKGAGEIASIADVGIRVARVKDDKGDKVKLTDDYLIMLQKVRYGSPVTINCKINFPSGRIKEI